MENKSEICGVDDVLGGGVSYYIYLTHIKLSCIYCDFVGSKHLLVLIIIVLVSVLLYLLNKKIVRI